MGDKKLDIVDFDAFLGINQPVVEAQVKYEVAMELLDEASDEFDRKTGGALFVNESEYATSHGRDLRSAQALVKQRKDELAALIDDPMMTRSQKIRAALELPRRITPNWRKAFGY